MTNSQTIVIGAGAAGYMAAITAAEAGHQVTILEKSNKTLAKVRISGGGRCNVTHDCTDPKTLVTHYPRGNKELLGAFHRFGQPETIAWFGDRGVDLKVEADGRMFPTTDDSLTIVDCLEIAAYRAGVEVRLSCAVTDLRFDESTSLWHLETTKQPYVASKVIIATGGGPKSESFSWLADLGLPIKTPVPSLFTFNLPSAHALKQLLGVSVPSGLVSLPKLKAISQGPILITHWGLSGPAVLRLSAWQARALAEANYETEVVINWVGAPRQQCLEHLFRMRKQEPLKQLSTFCPFDFPKRLWDHLLEQSELPDGLRWADASNTHLEALINQVCNSTYQMQGKTTFVDEFVTCGGVALKAIDFRTMASKQHQGLHFCGEVLDIDGITGGFNFQAAWTTGYLAGRVE